MRILRSAARCAGGGWVGAVEVSNPLFIFKAQLMEKELSRYLSYYGLGLKPNRRVKNN